MAYLYFAHEALSCWLLSILSRYPRKVAIAAAFSPVTVSSGLFSRNCLDPCDHSLYKFGKLHRARQVLSSLLSGNELKHEHP